MKPEKDHPGWHTWSFTYDEAARERAERLGREASADHLKGIRPFAILIGPVSATAPPGEANQDNSDPFGADYRSSD